jgi:hypothetical protein
MQREGDRAHELNEIRARREYERASERERESEQSASLLDRVDSVEWLQVQASRDNDVVRALVDAPSWLVAVIFRAERLAWSSRDASSPPGHRALRARPLASVLAPSRRSAQLWQEHVVFETLAQPLNPTVHVCASRECDLSRSRRSRASASNRRPRCSCKRFCYFSCSRQVPRGHCAQGLAPGVSRSCRRLAVPCSERLSSCRIAQGSDLFLSSQMISCANRASLSLTCVDTISPASFSCSLPNSTQSSRSVERHLPEFSTESIAATIANRQGWRPGRQSSFSDVHHQDHVKSRLSLSLSLPRTLLTCPTPVRIACRFNGISIASQPNGI